MPLSRSFTLCLLIVCFITACSNNQTASAPPSITSTLSPTLTATNTATPEPTPTPTPSQTPTPTTTHTPTLPPPTLTATPSPLLTYLAEALDIMETNSINRDILDWQQIRANAYTQAESAESYADIYTVIDRTLDELGDNHSFFLNPTAATQLQDGTFSDDQPAPTGMLLAGRIGYVNLPSFIGRVGSTAFATEIQEVISEVDESAPCGWVVDLRENIGGNMWPMLAGIGPILGEGEVGSFMDPAGIQQYWYYENGQSRQDDFILAEISGEPYELNTPDPPVAVLTSNMTASSGEAVVVAFRARPNTRSFGTATYGVSTANNAFELSDGAQIFLTVSTFVDRAGNLYGKDIAPDALITNQEEIITAATEWLLTQDACTNE